MIPIHDFNITPKSNMVICSFANGNKHMKGLHLMKPTVEYYGEKHNIDTLLFTKSFVPSHHIQKRNKIVLLFNLLRYYEFVMWIDSDAMFVNFDIDIRDEIQSEHIIYMTSYYGRNPLFPNSGVIVAKRDKKTDEILQLVWNHKKKSSDVWWDQQAFLKCLGFKNKITKIISYNGPTKYTSLIGTLDDKWNSRPKDKDVAEHPMIEHYCGFRWDYRIKKMESQFQEFQKEIGKNLS